MLSESDTNRRRDVRRAYRVAGTCFENTPGAIAQIVWVTVQTFVGEHKSCEMRCPGCSVCIHLKKNIAEPAVRANQVHRVFVFADHPHHVACRHNNYIRPRPITAATDWFYSETAAGSIHTQEQQLAPWAARSVVTRVNYRLCWESTLADITD